MASPPIAVGIGVGTQPPLGRVKAAVALARVLRLDSLWTVDHFLGFVPQSIWTEDFTWAAKPGTSPDEYYDYQVLLGWLARRAGRLRLAVGVTEPIRRHPVLIAQAFLTLAHLVKRPPILGLGAGERENIEPYGLDFSRPVSVLEEALQVVRLCLDSRGPVDFSGEHFRLDGALMDLRAPPGRAPEVWIAAHGPRMLRLAGRFGDGWYPTLPMGPDEYAAKLDAVRGAARDAGRDPGAIVPAMQTFFVGGADDASARALLATKPVRFGALLASDEVWRRFGAVHPLGEGFRGMVDFVPTRYGRDEMEDLIAQVPADLLEEGVIWGGPDRIVAKLRALGEAGLRHVVLAPLSALVSKRNAAGSLRVLASVSRRLRAGS